jgi:DNA helicase-2/ATP-dependent DNA helicase PcrA
MRNALLQAYIDEFGLETKAGIRELLNCLEELGIPAAITSSSPPDRIQEQLTSVGLYHRFTAICSGYNVPNGKPAPDIYLHGAASLGLRPETCLALEDARTGIEAAYRANCLSVIVPDLDQPGEEILTMSFAKADSLLDVADFIKKNC